MLHEAERGPAGQDNVLGVLGRGGRRAQSKQGEKDEDEAHKELIMEQSAPRSKRKVLRRRAAYLSFPQVRHPELVEGSDACGWMKKLENSRQA
jgi:hypothetical protein